VDHDDVFRTEVNIRDHEGEKIFARKSTPDEAVSIMRSAIDSVDFMNLPGWRDVTEEILGRDDNSKG
jgi:hypothetical protein